LSPQLTIRFPKGPASASDIKSVITARLFKSVLCPEVQKKQHA
jgi:hypothetical protein